MDNSLAIHGGQPTVPKGLGKPWPKITQEDKDAAKARDRVAKKMTRSQIAEAQKLASECVEKNFKGCGRPKQ